MRIFTEKDYKGEFNLKVMERIYIRLALNKNNGHRRKAAKVLKITERTLHNKLIQHSLK